jgi:hypothetical protein
MARRRHVIDVDDYEEIEEEATRRSEGRRRRDNRVDEDKNEDFNNDEDDENEDRNRDYRNNNERRSNNGNPNNFDLGQFSDLLKGVDMEQLNAMIGSLMGGSGGSSGGSRREEERGRRSRSSETHSDRNSDRYNERKDGRHRERSGRSSNAAAPNNNGFDFGQLAGILKNVDIGQIASLLGNFGGFAGGAPAGSGGPGLRYAGDRRMDILNALKPMVSEDRANIIDVIMQFYSIARILKP